MNAEDVDWVKKARDFAPDIKNFVDGRRKAVQGGDELEKYGPRDGKVLVRFDAGSERDVDVAVSSARRAFEDGRWSNLSAQHRKDVLLRLASLIEVHRDEFALRECLDVGKPISSAMSFDVPAAVATLRFNAEAVDKWYGKVYGVDRSSLSYQLHRPLGVVASIIGWNFPLLLAVEKIGPALATGNSLVLKPSELTSLSAARVAELAIEAGVPEGVFNVVHGGAPVGAVLARHRAVNLLSFTGSTQTGKKLLIAAGESNMKRLILECGGKAPNIVFDDSPSLDAAADAIVARAFQNQGQVCSASSRLLIQESIQGELLPLIIKKSAALQAGDPLNPATQFGAVVSQGHREKVLNYIDIGKKEGACVAYQSDTRVPVDGGFYIPPVIFSNVSPDQKIAQEEIFGPVLSVISFRDEEEAIRIANNTIYGLSAILWTTDLGRAHRVIQGIHAGWIVVNGTEYPKGGTGKGVLSIGGHKESGVGTEGGLEGLEAYTSRTAVQLFV